MVIWILVLIGLLLLAMIAWLSRGAQDLSDLTVIIREPEPGPYECRNAYRESPLLLAEREAGMRLLGRDES